jgi:hypothetical protein
LCFRCPAPSVVWLMVCRARASTSVARLPGRCCAIPRPIASAWLYPRSRSRAR